MSATPPTSRGQMKLVDVIMAGVVMVVILVTAPVWYTFADMAAADADPFSALLMRLIVPSLLLALAISAGVSARRRGGGPV